MDFGAFSRYFRVVGQKPALRVCSGSLSADLAEELSAAGGALTNRSSQLGMLSARSGGNRGSMAHLQKVAGGSFAGRAGMVKISKESILSGSHSRGSATQEEDSDASTDSETKPRKPLG